MIESLETRASEALKDYPYQWVSAVAHYAVDPDDPASARIAGRGWRCAMATGRSASAATSSYCARREAATAALCWPCRTAGWCGSLTAAGS